MALSDACQRGDHARCPDASAAPDCGCACHEEDSVSEEGTDG